MKLLTLNCHAWQEENQLDKIKNLAQVIKEKQYDVIALQEVMQLIDDENDEKVKDDNYAVVLLDELMKIGVTDYRFVWDLSHIGFTHYEEGLAILTRCEITGAKSFTVSQNTDIQNTQTRKIVNVEIKYKDKLFSIYSCHLGWYHSQEDPFLKQADQLLEKLNKNHINILMGDFNNDANRRDEGYDYLMNNGLFDTYTLAKEKDEGFTVKGKIRGWNQNDENLRLDLILIDKELKVNSSQVIFNGINEEVVSDHFGLEVKLDIN